MLWSHPPSTYRDSRGINQRPACCVHSPFFSIFPMPWKLIHRCGGPELVQEIRIELTGIHRAPMDFIVFENVYVTNPGSQHSGCRCQFYESNKFFLVSCSCVHVSLKTQQLSAILANMTYFENWVMPEKVMCFEPAVSIPSGQTHLLLNGSKHFGLYKVAFSVV